MTYTHVRFAYYDTYTQGQYQPAPMQNDPGLLDLRTEIGFRAQCIIGVARYLAEKIAAKPVAVPGRVLTIFAAPEFFFRSSVGEDSGYKHYEQAEVDFARHLIKASVAKEKIFDDWLLIPGTAVRSTYFDDRLSWLILNDAYCIARVPLPANGRRLAEWRCVKQQFSDIDNLDADNNAASRDAFGVVNQQIMSLEGVEIGLEICLDHNQQALKTTALKPPPSKIDVQVLVSCGSVVMPAGVVARTRGLVLRCNGNKLDPPPGREYKVVKWPRGGNPAMAEKPDLFELTQYHQSFVLPKRLQIRPNPNEPDTCGYFGPVAL